MAANRIKIAKDKATLVKSLIATDSTTGSFQTYADVIVFAAALGAKRKRRTPLKEVSKRDPDPIPQEHFVNKGYEMVIKLLAIAETKDKQVLASDEEYDDKRINIFEEYANGGLEILQDELRGAVDYSAQLLLLLNSERVKSDLKDNEFNLSRFLT